MLLAVNKPGRPLTSCPHLTPHLNCDCRRVVAAFPRKRTKCPCPPGDKPPTAVALPPSPTKHTFKVDKSITAANSRQTSRRATLESYADRIDTSHVNVIPAPQYRPQQPIAPALGNGFPITANNQFVGFMQSDPALQDPNMLIWQGLNAQFPAGISPQFIPKTMAPVLGGGFAPKQEFLNGNGTTNGFVNGHGNGISDNTMYQFTPAHAKMDSGVSGLVMPVEVPSAPGSMSSSESPVALQAQGTSQLPFQGSFQGQYNPMQSMHTQVPFFANPATYGTPEPSITAPQWQQMSSFALPDELSIASTGFTYQNVANGGLPQESMPSCSCGDGCNCLGCEMHLHNRRTTQYVQKAAREQWIVAPGYTSPPANKTSPASGIEDDVEVNGIDYLFTEFTFPCAGDKSSCQCPEGCECDGCQTHEGIQCWGEEGSCPCGPECSCVGCTVHGNDTDKAIKKEVVETTNGNGASYPSSEEDEPPKRSCCQ